MDNAFNCIKDNENSLSPAYVHTLFPATVKACAISIFPWDIAVLLVSNFWEKDISMIETSSGSEM